MYPAIMSSIENKEMQIISKVMAQLKEDEKIQIDNHSILPTPNTLDLIPFSPTPIDPIFSATSSRSLESNDTPTPATMQQQDEEEGKMTATAINTGDQVHTIWRDDTPGNFDILYKRDGADYDPTTVNFSNDSGLSNDAAIAVLGNNVHIVWVDATLGNEDILYSRSTNSGGSFGSVINLSNDAGNSFSPAIAVSGNNVYVVWDDDTPGSMDILYKRSTDGGASFTEPTKNLSNNAGGSFLPDVAVSGNNVHVVWD